MRGDQPRTLLFDVETLPATVYVWRAKAPKYISFDNLVEEAHMACAAWKWLGEDRVYTARMDQSLAQPDLPIVRALSAAWNQADAIVAHNGDEFDVKWMKGRMAKGGLPPPKPLIQIDTLKISRQQYGENCIFSHKLDALAEFFGIPVRKIKVPFDLWKQVKRGVPGSLKQMVTYNIRDLHVLEPVYMRVRPFAPARLNQSLWSSRPDACPYCSLPELISRGIGRSRTGEYRRFACKACGGWSSQPMSSKVVR